MRTMTLALSIVLSLTACSASPGAAPPSVDLASYTWELSADETPWGGRAGLQVVELDGSLFLLGGRTPRQSTIPGDSDIWADVWRSDDLGHQCEVLGDDFVCFGGFGLDRNPMDAWFSPNGVEWTELDDPPWNAATSDRIRYDFDAITVDAGTGPTVLTFGGDRETFDFSDADNYLRIEDDVWRFAPPSS